MSSLFSIYFLVYHSKIVYFFKGLENGLVQLQPDPILALRRPNGSAQLPNARQGAAVQPRMVHAKRRLRIRAQARFHGGRSVK